MEGECSEVEDVVSLPSDASSVVELPPDAEPLPEAVHDREAMCCLSGCQGALNESPALKRRVLELQQSLEAATKDQKVALQFHCLRDWGTGTGWRRYRVWNMSPLQRRN